MPVAVACAGGVLRTPTAAARPEAVKQGGAPSTLCKLEVCVGRVIQSCTQAAAIAHPCRFPAAHHGGTWHLPALCQASIQSTARTGRVLRLDVALQHRFQCRAGSVHTQRAGREVPAASHGPAKQRAQPLLSHLPVLLQAGNVPACSSGCLEILPPGQIEEESPRLRYPAVFGCLRSGLSLGESVVTSLPEMPSGEGSGVTQMLSPDNAGQERPSTSLLHRMIPPATAASLGHLLLQNNRAEEASMTRHATTHCSAEGPGTQGPVTQPQGSKDWAPTAPSGTGLSCSRRQGHSWAMVAAPHTLAGVRAISRTGRATPGAGKHPAQEEEEKKEEEEAATGVPPGFPQPQ
ncbi:uncharacterized protein LJ264_012448 [Porphyrio hochstetteri]